MTRSLRLALVALGIPVVALLAVLITRPGTEQQVSDAFADIRQALADGDADGVMARLDPAYDFRAQWPRLMADVDLIGLGGNPSDKQGLRDRIEGIGGMYLANERKGGNTAVLDAVLDEVLSDDGDTVQARLRIGLTGSARPLTVSIAPPMTVAFTFRRQGWLRPRLTITAHEPLDNR